MYQFGNINQSPEQFNFTLECSATPYLPTGTVVEVQCSDVNCQISQSWTVQAPVNASQIFGFDQTVPISFSSGLTVTITPASGTTLPNGAMLTFNYLQIPNQNNDLEMTVSRKRKICRSTTNFTEISNSVTVENLIPVGQCTLVVKSN